MSEPVSSTLPPELLRTIDPVCDAFEAAWQEGRRPAIEDYLGTVLNAVQPQLLDELVRLELEWRCRQGDEPTVEAYRSRFAACADTIETWLTEARQAAETLTLAAPADTADPVALITPATFPPALSPSATPPPRVLGEYELLEQLGAGGMGEVYRARHKRLDKLVAVKVLATHARDSAARTARFLREIKAVGSLDHPNVVEAHDAGEQAGVTFLVMKLIDGEDLGRVVKKRGPLPVAEACDLARQTALGLHYLHERGLIHRDLKPSNLMRTPDGTVKILDLGLARWHLEGKAGDDLTASGLVMGTPDYQAPEQVRRAAKVDIRADLYGLGTTLFFLLTGRAPFAHHPGLYEKLAAHQGEAPPDVRQFRPEVPAALADLVERLLAKKPEDRPQSPAEVAAALAAIIGGLASAPTLSSLSVSPAVQRGRRRWPWLAAGVFLVVVSFGVALSIRWPEPPGPPPGKVVAAPPMLAVLSLDVHHFAKVSDQFDKDCGVLGKRSFATRRDDAVTVAAKLSRPAYAFLIAFRPDGTEEACFPENEDEPPPLTAEPRYPSVTRGVMYGLNEGEGLQVFALVASSKPLPAYKVWRPKCGAALWTKFPAAAGVVWWDNGKVVVPLTADDPGGQRGKGQPVAGKTPVTDLTDWLRRAPGVEEAAAVGFAVLPRKGL